MRNLPSVVDILQVEHLEHLEGLAEQPLAVNALP